MTAGRRSVVLGLAAAFAATLIVVSAPESAEAFSVDATDADFTFDYSSGGNGTLLSGGSPTTTGAVVLYDTVATIDGVAIDAVVTTEVSNATIENYDNIGSASTNPEYFQVNMTSTAAGGYTAFTFEFFERGSYTGPGTGIPVTLLNVAVTSIDIDTPGTQFQDFVGYQTYVFNSPSRLVAIDQGAGVTRFEQGTPTSGSNVPADAVQVTFSAVQTFVAKFGNEDADSVGYYGITFQQLTDVYPTATPAAPVNNPSNRPPTSADTTRYVPNGEAWTLQDVDFGPYSDPDLNPLAQVRIATLPSSGSLEKYVGGAWVPVVAGDDLAIADIEDGNVRFTGSVDDALTFQVHDGLTYSLATYTMDLLMSTQGQVITFANPGQKAPTDPPFASGATASSGLPVTLESLTPGVCTVSGLDITPVTEGTCTVVARQSGDRDYGAADPVTQTFPISTKTPQTITAPNPGAQVYAGSPTVVSVTSTSSSGLTTSINSLTPSVCTVSGTDVTILGPGTCTLRHTQPGDATYAAAPIVQYSFGVTTAYTLTYDGNGSDSGTVPSSQVANGDVTLSGNSGSLARDGFVFDGWRIGATDYDGGDTYSLTADAVASAIWTPTYTITYDANGATSGVVPTAQTAPGAQTLAANTGGLVRPGYTFGGWTILAADYGTGDSYTPSGDVVASAIWTLTPVTAVSDSALASTGTASTTPWLALAAGLVLMGAALVGRQLLSRP